MYKVQKAFWLFLIHIHNIFIFVCIVILLSITLSSGDQ